MATFKMHPDILKGLSESSPLHSRTYGEMYGEPSPRSDQKRNSDTDFLCFTVSLCTYVFFMILFVIACLTFEVACIVISLHYEDKPCYVNKSIMPLNRWLILISSFKIVGLMIILIQTLCLLFSAAKGKSDQSLICQGILTASTVLFYSIGLLFITIIGIVELVAQFDPCRTEATVIDVLSVITVIISLGGVSCTCRCTKSK